jgi:hypothetical protein
MNPTRKLLTAGALSTALLTPLAHANLVTNGGFETGDFTGWTTSMEGGGPASTLLLVSTGSQRTGTFSARFGALNQNDVISQTLTTVAGDRYDISFWFQTFSSNYQFVFNWDGGAAELTLVDQPAPSYTEYTFSLLASTNSTTLSFAGRNPPSFSRLDDVSVTQATASVPLPGTLALIGIALAGLGVARLRRR